MKRELKGNELRDLLSRPKKFTSTRVAGKGKQILKAADTQYFFKRLGLSPAQPHSKMYGR